MKLLFGMVYFHDKNIGRERILRTIVCVLLCLLGISRVAFAQQEDNLLRQEYQTAMEQHVQDMIAALSMYSSDIHYEKENVLRERRVKLIRVFFRSEQAKMFDFLKIGVETEDNYLNVMEFLKTIPVVLPRVTFNMSVEEIFPYVRLANGEFKLPVKVAITFVDLNTGQERMMPSRVYNVYCWQSGDGDFAVSSMDLLREQQQTLSETTTGSTSGKTYEEYKKMADEFYDKKNYTEALKYYKLSAPGNDGAVLNRLGYMYSEGEGVDADATEAVKWFRKSAEQGYMVGQYNMGLMYELGKGVGKDVNEAYKWHLKAAENGDAYSMNSLGILFENGQGVEVNFSKAVEWYRKAANTGNIYGQYNLGRMYENGFGIPKNIILAKQWYEKAVTQNFSDAQNALGAIYYNGDGVAKDYAKAMEWYRKAADQGNMYGEFNIGLLYEFGYGVTKNLDEAVKWYRRAANRGMEQAKTKLKELGR